MLYVSPCQCASCVVVGPSAEGIHIDKSVKVMPCCPRARLKGWRRRSMRMFKCAPVVMPGSEPGTARKV